MITFKQFLIEADNNTDLVEFLRKNCLPACKDILEANKYFLRGSWKASHITQFKVGDEIVRGHIERPRTDRRPRDTPRWVHDAVDDFFEDKFNVQLRSASLFVSSGLREVTGYGKIYIVIPMGNYHSYFSPKVLDLTTELFPDGINEIDTSLIRGDEFWKDEGIPKPTKAQQLEELKLFLKDAKYQDNNIEALKHKGEVMLVCSSYLALPHQAIKDDIMSLIHEAVK